ncbi:DnaJ domain-containing protein [Halorubellus sp. JP-L1]|uniref:J domain-containing protein n=1 Tax=Halorubellus sp. JP-L1 TaxID=2715753 RepID=UPI00140A47C4|nr:DnaJ domain-containing protein [Halorubellus sp. JP-L1]NHN40451.1 DnaJ domain-containing protein [Halorubellus sp. JP-L1]
MAETFYDVLGVERTATQDEIEAAYRERVKETHPDLNDSPDATDAFQRVQAAEDVLGDPDERARYDRLGHASYTTHVAGGTGGDGSRWDVGSDRRADEAGRSGTATADSGAGADDGGADAGGAEAGGADANGGVGADDRFGFDPGAYDRTRARAGDGNPSERSYDVGGESVDGAGGNGAGGDGAGGDNTAAGDGGTSASATSADGYRERARRSAREWSKERQRQGRGSTDGDDDGGYSVHDWDDEELDTSRVSYELQGSEAVVVGIMFVLYPFVAYSAVSPQFSLFVNVTVAVCALALTGYLLTMPRIGCYVFGAWSVIAPAVLLAVPGLEVLSLLGLVFLGGTWIPFGYSVLFMRVLR